MHSTLTSVQRALKLLFSCASRSIILVLVICRLGLGWTTCRVTRRDHIYVQGPTAADNHIHYGPDRVVLSRRCRCAVVSMRRASCISSMSRSRSGVRSIRHVMLHGQATAVPRSFCAANQSPSARILEKDLKVT